MKKQLYTIFALVCAVIFAPTTLIFFFGMMPTIAANVLDRTRQKSRTLSVGVLNFAGCMPFLLELWMSNTPNSIDHALAIIMQAKVVVIVYSIAAAGYAIEATVTGMVATLMQQRAKVRLRTIDKELQELTDRWGDYVDGSVLLDEFGFPHHDEHR